ncbi:MAG: ThuA domain-containing protein [Clostridia bacterium]|nr:ThuA domain-containing protein [Clostridia bacterium]
MIRVTIWNEYRHEREEEAIGAVYPEGIHGAIAVALGGADFAVRTATLDMPEHGLTQQVLDDTDVLFWWAHVAHEEVQDAVVDRVHARVLDGMGLVCLHSGHGSKLFQRLMGTRTGRLRWRDDGELNRLWVLEPGHPIAAGLGDFFDIPHDETYGEHFEIPAPDELVFVTWHPGGEVFRSGCCWRRGQGRVFYFQPGHETDPVYRQAEVQLALRNAARWAAPVAPRTPFTGYCGKREG